MGCKRLKNGNCRGDSRYIVSYTPEDEKDQIMLIIKGKIKEGILLNSHLDSVYVSFAVEEKQIEVLLAFKELTDWALRCGAKVISDDDSFEIKYPVTGGTYTIDVEAFDTNNQLYKIEDFDIEILF